MNFKNIRITLLLLILGYILIDTFLSDKRATNWTRSLRVVIYPINADGSEQTAKYISQLKLSDFDKLNTMLIREGEKYQQNLSNPLHIALAPELKSMPPLIPQERSGLGVIWWSIKLRFWSWKEDNYNGPKAQTKAYALYYDPETHKRLEHSTGLKEAKIAINYLYSDNKQTDQNNVVLLHEILHTLGATDKYDLRTGLPQYPEGYAESEKQPLYPQKKAELMGGRIAISRTEAKIPNSLDDVVIGTITAKEIGWIK